MEPRILTGYEYKIGSVFGDGCIWADSRHGHVKWQHDATNTETAWHGTFNLTRCGIEITFDCFGREDHMKTTKLDATFRGEFVGKDYDNRYVCMRPVVRYLYDEGTANWKEKQQWCPNCLTWQDVQSDVLPLVAPDLDTTRRSDDTGGYTRVSVSPDLDVAVAATAPEALVDPDLDVAAAAADGYTLVNMSPAA